MQFLLRSGFPTRCIGSSSPTAFSVDTCASQDPERHRDEEGHHDHHEHPDNKPDNVLGGHSGHLRFFGLGVNLSMRPNFPSVASKASASGLLVVASTVRQCGGS
jgi:hypothetical protein